MSIPETAGDWAEAMTHHYTEAKLILETLWAENDPRNDSFGPVAMAAQAEAALASAAALRLFVECYDGHQT